MSATIAAQDRTSVIVGTITLASGAAVVAGVSLPWLSVFHGIRSYNGWIGANGKILAAAGVSASVVGLVTTRRRFAAARYAVGAIGCGIAVFGIALVARLVDAYRGLRGVLEPTLGPGLFLVTAAGVLLMLTMFAPLERPERTARTDRPREPTAWMLFGLSIMAGTIHLAVAPAHLAEFTAYGVFFIAVGLGQIAWAIAIVIVGTRRSLPFAAAANLLLIVLWVLSRTIGLPIGPQPGQPETFGVLDITASAVEALLVLVAIERWNRSRRTSARILGVDAKRSGIEAPVSGNL
jgi:hypothetical protein